jgi:hypothetical protein
LTLSGGASVREPLRPISALFQQPPRHKILSPDNSVKNLR